MRILHEKKNNKAQNPNFKFDLNFFIEFQIIFKFDLTIELVKFDWSMH